MKKIQISETINAPKEKVWEVLWNDASYRRWTSVFHEGSHMKTDWQEGGKVYFLGPDGGGMFSILERYLPNEYVAFRHIGQVKNGEEQPETEESKKWSGILEDYSVKESDGKTVLTAGFEADEEGEAFFRELFPKALAIVKELAEKTD